MTRYQAIAEYMNMRCFDRQFTAFDCAIINNAINEYLAIKEKGLPRTRKIFDMNNQKVAEILEGKYKAEHIKFYKRCRCLEYEHRTGKPAYRWQNIQNKYY